MCNMIYPQCADMHASLVHLYPLVIILRLTVCVTALHVSGIVAPTTCDSSRTVSATGCMWLCTCLRVLCCICIP